MTDRPYRLRLPGPTPVPDRVTSAMAAPMVNHRGPEFKEMMEEVQQGLQALFGADGPVLVFGSSGSGAMEASFVNVLSPGDRALVVANGQWGERFVVMTRALGADVTVIESAWGQPVDLDRIREALDRRSYRALIVTHNESSTGAALDLAAVGALIADRDTLLVVDAVSSLGGMRIDQSAVGADVVFSASQKALMCPPGLSFASVSEKAWSALRRASDVPRIYWDFENARASLAKYETPFTPPVSLLFGLREALRMIHEEGSANVFTRHTRMANALRAGMEVLGLPSFPPAAIVSSTLAVGAVPDGLDGSSIVKRMYEDHGSVIAGARNRLKGRIVRIGTMGTIGEEDVVTDLRALAATLASLGHACDVEAAVQAARQSAIA